MNRLTTFTVFAIILAIVGTLMGSVWEEKYLAYAEEASLAGREITVIEYREDRSSEDRKNNIVCQTHPEAPKDHYLPNMTEYEPEVWIWQDMTYEVCIRTKDKSALSTHNSQGISMQPTSIDGSVLVIAKEFDIKNLTVGTAIMWKHPEFDKPRFHRIWKISEDEEGWYAITKGDNTIVIDSVKIREEHILGVKVAII